MKFYISILFSSYFQAYHCELTSIALTPTNNVVKDTQLGNTDLSTVSMTPANTFASCYVKQAFSAATGVEVEHPFNVRYEAAAASSYNWIVIFDSTSPFKLDSTVVPIYTVIVGCLQNAVTQSANLTVQVLPNQRPALIDYPGKVISYSAPTVPAGMLLYKVTATDGDGDVLTYTYNIQPAVSFLSIDQVTNEISAAVDFRSVTIPLVTINVDVTDGFDTLTGFKLQIQILNLNTRPEITNLPAAVTMKEDVNGGTLLIDLLYQDPDYTGSFIPDCSVFPNINPSIISISGSRLTLANGGNGKSLLDYEAITSYRITCTIFDGYLYSENDVLTLNVDNVNEPPIFNQASGVYNCQLQESKAGGSSCNLFLSVQDPESDAYTISIRPGNNNERFTFASPSSDILTFATDYDVDNNAMPSSVSLDIEARDANGAAGFAQIKVTITDVNDNEPVFPGSQPVIELNDLTPIGLVGILQASDADSGLNGEVEYRATTISPLTAANYLNVLGNGQIHYTKQFPDTWSGTTILLTADAEDKGIPSKKASTTQTVRFVTLPTTTQPPPATTQPDTTPNPLSQQPEQGYFDEPANIAMVAVLGVILFIALLIALFFCMRKLFLGYCCTRPSHGRVHPYNGYPPDYYTPPRQSRYSGYPRYYREPSDHVDPREYYRDPRYHRDPRHPLSAGSIHGEIIAVDDRRSKPSRLALQPF